MVQIEYMLCQFQRQYYNMNPPQNQQESRAQLIMKTVSSKIYAKYSRPRKIFQPPNLSQNKNPELTQLVATISNKKKKANEKLIQMKPLLDNKTIVLGYEKVSERGDLNFIDAKEPRVNDFFYNKIQGGLGGLQVMPSGRNLLLLDKKGLFSFVDLFQGPNIEDIKDKSVQTMYDSGNDMAIGPGGNMLVVGRTQGCVVLDLEGKKFTGVRKFNNHIYSVTSVAWHQYYNLILTSSLDSKDMLRLWDPRSQEPVYQTNYHQNTIIKSQFHQNGLTYYSMGRDNNLFQYDIRFRKIYNRYPMPSEPTCLCHLPNNNIAVGSSGGNLTFFASNGQEVLSSKGNSIVNICVDDAKQILVVARQKEHTFQIFTVKDNLHI